MAGQIRNKANTGKGMLTDDQVRAIRKSKELYLENSKGALAERFSVPKYVIDNVWNDKSYNHVI